VEIGRFDLSRLPHPTLLNIFQLFVPGLFFEIVVGIANPGLVDRAMSPAHGWLSSHHYAQHLSQRFESSLGAVAVLLFLFVALLFGSLGEMWLRALRWLIGGYYRCRSELKRRELNSSLPQEDKLPIELAGEKKKLGESTEALLVEYAAAVSAWRATATRFLGRYRIKAPPSNGTHEEWEPWRAILGYPWDRTQLGRRGLPHTLHSVGRLVWPGRVLSRAKFEALRPLVLLAWLSNSYFGWPYRDA
jgi:hypothetical protein